MGGFVCKEVASRLGAHHDMDDGCPIDTNVERTDGGVGTVRVRIHAESIRMDRLCVKRRSDGLLRQLEGRGLRGRAKPSKAEREMHAASHGRPLHRSASEP